jgi:RNA polymerase sigma factor (sigma-70 family)
MNRSEQPHQPSIAENGSRNDDKGPATASDSVNFVRCLRDELTALRHQSDCGAPSEDVWVKFFGEYAPILWRLVKAHHRPAEDREDDMQDLYLTLMTGLKSFELDPSRGSFEDWISVVAQHRLVDCKRCRKNRPTLRLGRLDADELPGRDPDPVDAFERRVVQELVRDALDELRQLVADRDHEAFRLRWIEGCSVDQIAERLGMSEGQVWSSHHRTRQKLVPVLQARGLGPRA